MDIAIAIAFLVGAGWLASALVQRFGLSEAQRAVRDPADDRLESFGFFSALGILILAVAIRRGVVYLLPEMDAPAEIAVSLGVYLLALTGLLAWCAGASVLRAALLAIVIALTLMLRAIVLVVTGAFG